MNIFKYFLILSVLFISFATTVYAQETTYLVITQYESPKDEPILIQNNETIFEYYENIEGSLPVMLSVMTELQKDTLLSRGFELQIVEENPDMTTYRLLYNPLANQASKLSSYGKIYTLTKNHTLIKLNEGTQLSLSEGLSKFTLIPLQNIGIHDSQFTTVQNSKTEEMQSSNSYRQLIGSIIMIIFFIVISGVFIYIKHKKKQVS